MKFQVIAPGGFVHGTITFEEGNSHDSDVILKQYSADDRSSLVKFFHEQGWISCDELGADVPWDSKKSVVLDIHSISVENSSTLGG